MNRYVVEVIREDLPSGFVTSGDSLTPYLTQAYVFADEASAIKVTKKHPSKYTGWGKVTYDVQPVTLVALDK